MRRRSVEVTTVARTLVDVAVLLDGRPLERALDEAHYLGLLDSSVLAVTLDRNAGRAGARRLGAVLAGHEPGSTRTRSELEERFLALCSTHRLPRPRVNVVVDGLEVDFLWAAARVIVETDGYAAHNGLAPSSATTSAICACAPPDMRCCASPGARSRRADGGSPRAWPTRSGSGRAREPGRLR